MRNRILAPSFYRRAFSIATNANAAVTIQRHGLGDGVVTLNVGGKQFQTLRSTVAQNPVLMDHVVRAEANAELTGSGGDRAVFIDRDPAHFGTILAYLRNKADGVHRSPGVARRLMKFGGDKTGTAGRAGTGDNCRATTQAIAESMSSASVIQLPKDAKALTEMYYEAKHYNIEDLAEHICSQQVLTRLFRPLGTKNPFEMARNAVAAGRNFLVLLGTMITGKSGWEYSQSQAGQAKEKAAAPRENNGSA